MCLFLIFLLRFYDVFLVLIIHLEAENWLKQVFFLSNVQWTLDYFPGPIAIFLEEIKKEKKNFRA